MMSMKVHVLKDNSPQAVAAIKRAGDEACKKACEFIQDHARANIARDTGHGAERIEIIGEHKVVAAFEYAVYLEQGTSPHWPPIDALEGWASRHGFEKPYLVAWSIAQKGTPAQPFFKPACDAAKNMSFGVRIHL